MIMVLQEQNAHTWLIFSNWQKTCEVVFGLQRNSFHLSFNQKSAMPTSTLGT